MENRLKEPNKNNYYSCLTAYHERKCLYATINAYRKVEKLITLLLPLPWLLGPIQTSNFSVVESNHFNSAHEIFESIRLAEFDLGRSNPELRTIA